MNIYDPYPEEVEVDGCVYRLNLNYDRVLRVMDVQEGDLPALDKLEVQAALLLADGEEVPRQPEDQARLIKAVFELFPREESTTGERYIDFHQDAALIRSAFYRIGVDLLRDKIHFMRFMELLADLPQDTALMRTVEIRQRPIPKPNKNNAAEIAALQKAKARVAIKYSEEERRARFSEALKRSSIMRG